MGGTEATKAGPRGTRRLAGTPRTAVLSLGFALFLGWPSYAFFMRSLLAFDVHGDGLGNLCWVVSLGAVALGLLVLGPGRVGSLPRLCARKALVAAAAAFLIANGMVAFGASVAGMPGSVVALAGAAATGLVNSLFCLAWGTRLLQVGDKGLPVFVSLSYLLCYLIAAIFSLMGDAARLTAVFVLVLVFCIALVASASDGAGAGSDLGGAVSTDGAGAGGAAQPPRIIALSPRDYVVVFCCFVAVGVANDFYQPSQGVDQVPFSFVLLGAAALAMIVTLLLVKTLRRLTFSNVTRVVAPMLAAGLFLSCYLPEEVNWLAYVVVFAGMSITVIFIWVQGVVFGRRADRGVAGALGTPLAVHYLGAVAGTVLMGGASGLDSSMLAFLMVVVMCAVVITWPNDEEVQAPIAEQVANLREESFRRVAETYGLTERESEVFALFASGRSSTHICEALSISKNTVDTHLRHIYDKTGIRNKQGLIDLAQTAERELLDPEARS